MQAKAACQGDCWHWSIGPALKTVTVHDSTNTDSQIERPVLWRDLLPDVIHTELITVQVAICAGIEASALAGLLLRGGRLHGGCLSH